jgi:cell shape-determining protein MreD
MSRGGAAGVLGYTHREVAWSACGVSIVAAESRGNPELSTYLMSVLAPAVGAVLAAILESSVLSHLEMGNIKPDLVFAVGVAVAMVLGFESGMTWAFAGGIALDLLMPGRALGSTTLTLILGLSLALLVARAMWPPRLVVIAGTALGLSFVFQILLLGLLTLTADVAFTGLSVGDLLVVGFMNGVIAALAAVLIRALDLRFGEPERLAW